MLTCVLPLLDSYAGKCGPYSLCSSLPLLFSRLFAAVSLSTRCSHVFAILVCQTFTFPLLPHQWRISLLGHVTCCDEQPYNLGGQHGTLQYRLQHAILFYSNKNNVGFDPMLKHFRGPFSGHIWITCNLLLLLHLHVLPARQQASEPFRPIGLALSTPLLFITCFTPPSLGYILLMRAVSTGEHMPCSWTAPELIWIHLCFVCPNKQDTWHMALRY